MTEAEAYSLALEEAKSGPPVREIWLRAFANSNGDEKSTLARYVQFRGQDLLVRDTIARKEAAILQRNETVKQVGIRAC